jgi:hypothetical protein
LTLVRLAFPVHRYYLALNIFITSLLCSSCYLLSLRVYIVHHQQWTWGGLSYHKNFWDSSLFHRVLPIIFQLLQLPKLWFCLLSSEGPLYCAWLQPCMLQSANCSQNRAVWDFMSFSSLKDHRLKLSVPAKQFPDMFMAKSLAECHLVNDCRRLKSPLLCFYTRK